MLPPELNSVHYTNNLTLGTSVKGIRILQKGGTQIDVPILKYTSQVYIYLIQIFKIKIVSALKHEL